MPKLLKALIGRFQQKPEDTVLTTDEVWARADRLSREVLEVSREEALAMLERGELDGTVIEVELRMAQFLAGGTKRPS